MKKLTNFVLSQNNTFIIKSFLSLLLQFYQQDQREFKSMQFVDMDSRTPPHVCFNNVKEEKLCHAFTENSAKIAVNLTLGQPTNTEEIDEWCAYPISDYISCRIPSNLQSDVQINKTCSVQCKLEDPYTTPGKFSISI